MEKLEHCVFPEGALLVTLDVEALYTNIEHEVDVHAVTYFLDKQQDSNRLHDSLLIDLLDFVLKQICFVFDQWFYK